MRDEKRSRAKRREMPVSGNMITPPQLAMRVAPETERRLFEGSSPIAREHFERDMARLRESLAPARLEPKLSISAADNIRQLPATVDMRTGHIDARLLLPKGVQMPALGIPEGVADPEKTLAAAIKKAGHKK
jgi:hypothetical protein